jgi:hypothetical protein
VTVRPFVATMTQTRLETTLRMQWAAHR